MADYAYVGLSGTQEVDNAHAWLFNDSDGVEGGAFSGGTRIKHCRASAMGADGVFYFAGDDGMGHHVVVKSAYGADIVIWETDITRADSADITTGIIYEPVNDLIVLISFSGAMNVLSASGVEVWNFVGVSGLHEIVSDATGYVYVCGYRKADQLSEANTACLWKLEWDGTAVQYDVLAYYDFTEDLYGLDIDSAGSLLICGDKVGGANVVRKLTAALAVTTSWTIADFTSLYSCKWLSTGNFAVAGDMTGDHTKGQVQLINETTGVKIWESVVHTGGGLNNYVKTIVVDSSDNVHVIFGFEVGGE